MKHIKNPWMTILFLSSLALDLSSKHFMSTWLKWGQSKSVISGFFQFTLVHNRGAAFGVGSGWSTPYFLGGSAVALLVVLYMFWKLEDREKLSAIGLAMILAGAVGNIIDRVRLGYVIDFLDVYYKTHHWPVFNIADSLITVGAVFLAIEMFFAGKKKS
jgi:signal peptidase II